MFSCLVNTFILVYILINVVHILKCTYSNIKTYPSHEKYYNRGRVKLMDVHDKLRYIYNYFFLIIFYFIFIVICKNFNSRNIIKSLFYNIKHLISHMM